MKHRIAFFIVGLALVSGVAAQETELLRTKNLGLLINAPFLHQTELPHESEFLGAHVHETISYEYNHAGLPVLSHHRQYDTGIRSMDVEWTYGTGGRIESVTYSTYDESGREVAYVDRIEYSEHTPYGPERGLLTTEEQTTAELRMTYDEAGRLVSLEEENAYGDGLFRRERHFWTGEGEASLPYASEVQYPLSDETERYWYLYDASGLLRSLDGVNIIHSDPADRERVAEWYWFKSSSFEELFGPVVPDSE